MGVKLKSSRECPKATLAQVGGRPAEDCRSICIEGGVLPSGSVLEITFWELASETLTQLAILKLEWVVGASTNVRAWIMCVSLKIALGWSSDYCTSFSATFGFVNRIAGLDPAPF